MPHRGIVDLVPPSKLVPHGRSSLRTAVALVALAVTVFVAWQVVVRLAPFVERFGADAPEDRAEGR